VADRLTLGLPRTWGSVAAMPKSPIKPEQLSGLIKPVGCKEGQRGRKGHIDIAIVIVCRLYHTLFRLT